MLVSVYRSAHGEYPKGPALERVPPHDGLGRRPIEDKQTLNSHRHSSLVTFRSAFQYLKLVRCPYSLAPTLVTLPSMSLIPFAPFSFPRFSFSGSKCQPCRSAAIYIRAHSRCTSGSVKV